MIRKSIETLRTSLRNIESKANGMSSKKALDRFIETEVRDKYRPMAIREIIFYIDGTIGRDQLMKELAEGWNLLNLEIVEILEDIEDIKDDPTITL